ncbi:MAG: radical SAM family heme chaperone HemW [Acidimicrobiia bacterium]
MSDRPAAASEPDGPGCYVHIPFCARVCPYCDFAVVAGRDDLTDRYFAALLAEIEMEDSTGPLATVFIGGGTPSRVPAGLIGSVVDRLSDRFGLVKGAEISLEANPEDWSHEHAGELAAAGINRVSFGMQSFDDAVLAGLGRLHRADQSRAVVEQSRAAGMRSVSLDLIFGSPGETIESWARTIETAIELEPDHVSTYALTVERGTELSRQVAAGAPAPDADDQADKFGLAGTRLTDAGFTHYEVSNFTRPGHECLYNLNTWAQGDYLAFGVGAHGHRDGVRRRNIRKLDAYLERVERGERPEAGRETVSGWDRELERVFLGVRRRRGVVAPEVGRLLADDLEAQSLIMAGKLRVADDRIEVLDPLFTDAVARVVLGLEQPEEARPGS